MSDFKDCFTVAPHQMRRVVLESPYAGDVAANEAYARLCIRDCLMRGESPVASHLLYTQVNILNDLDPLERSLGINAGHAWIHGAQAMVVYTDRGISPGMEAGIGSAKVNRLPVEYRSLEQGAG